MLKGCLLMHHVLYKPIYKDILPILWKHKLQHLYDNHIFGEDKGNEGKHTSCPVHDFGRLLKIFPLI